MIEGGVESATYETAVSNATPGIAASDEYGMGMLRGYENAKAERGGVVTVRFTGRGAKELPVAIAIGGARAEIVGISEASDAPGYFDARVRVPANAFLRDGLARVSLSVGETISQAGVLLEVSE